MRRPGGALRPAQPCPSAEAAERISADLLAEVGTRLPHVRTAGRLAAGLAPLFSSEEASLLVAAATLHDIGYCEALSLTGFHPYDGAVYLAEQGFPTRLACLVGNHSFAWLTAARHGVHELASAFPAEDSLLADALAYSDMHSAPDGSFMQPERRLADIARRHPEPGQAERADLLRAAIDRVNSVRGAVLALS